VKVGIRSLAIYAVVVILGIVAVAASFSVRRRAEARNLAIMKQEAAEATAEAARIKELHKDIATRMTVPSGGNFTTLLRSAELDQATAYAITEAVRPVFNSRKLRAGDRVTFIKRYNGVLKAVQYRTGWDSEIEIVKTNDGFTASEKKLEASTQTIVVDGTIQSSLFESVLAAGEHPELAVRLAEIFAWDLDFYTDPQPGDSFHLVFERRSVPGDDTPTYGKIFAAEYVNGGHPYDAVLFRDPAGQPAYYTAEGKSLQKAFLRSPLKFAARVSSHFSMHRFHPVMKVYRAHLGTDYAAPVGTPVQAIANGRVEFSGFKGGNGNLIILRHSNGYESYYLHLSKRLVRNGQSVQQGQRIGLVGATGLASGPHLDFRLKQRGNFVNFERLKMPPANPVMKSEMPAFTEVRDKWISALHHAPETQTQVAAGAVPTKSVRGD
jgi:murein DD-endopeptidase MepM/ murein hydrolase activator NlpD